VREKIMIEGQTRLYNGQTKQETAADVPSYLYIGCTVFNSLDHHMLPSPSISDEKITVCA